MTHSYTLKAQPVVKRSNTSMFSSSLNSMTTTLGSTMPLIASYGMKATSMIASTTFEMVGLGISIGFIILSHFLK